MRTVLIAEDESSIRDFITVNLKIAGYTTIEAADGLQAVKLFEEYEKLCGDYVSLEDIIYPNGRGDYY